MSKHTLVGGQVLTGVHPEDKCLGQSCTIHRPSDHPMAEWPQRWAGGMMYRVAENGDLYPDPDSPNVPDRPNAVQCLGCDRVIVSMHRHDYQTCGCDYNSMVDGGYDYHRRGWATGEPGECYIEIEEWPIRTAWLE